MAALKENPFFLRRQTYLARKLQGINRWEENSFSRGLPAPWTRPLRCSTGAMKATQPLLIHYLTTKSCQAALSAARRPHPHSLSAWKIPPHPAAPNPTGALRKNLLMAWRSSEKGPTQSKEVEQSGKAPGGGGSQSGTPKRRRACFGKEEGMVALRERSSKAKA